MARTGVTMGESVPVAYFAYRRPDLVARSLAALRQNGVQLVYAFADGAREPALDTEVREVRRLLRAVDWAKVELVEHGANVGVLENVIGGVTRVLHDHEQVVVVEEDVELATGAYAWLCAALAHYTAEARVMGVTAWNHPRVTPADVTIDPYFSGRTTSLAWGTWRRAWNGVADTTCATLVEECRAQSIDPAAFGEDNVNAATHEVTHGMWDHRFNLHVLAHRGLFLWPARSMAAHLGYDSRATNSPHGAGWEDDPHPAPDPATVHWPAPVGVHPESGARWKAVVDAPPRASLFTRLLRRLTSRRAPQRQ